MPDLLHALLSIEPDVVVQFCALTMIALIFHVPSILSTYQSDCLTACTSPRIQNHIMYVEHWQQSLAGVVPQHIERVQLSKIRIY